MTCLAVGRGAAPDVGGASLARGGRVALLRGSAEPVGGASPCAAPCAHLLARLPARLPARPPPRVRAARRAPGPREAPPWRCLRDARRHRESSGKREGAKVRGTCRSFASHRAPDGRSSRRRRAACRAGRSCRRRQPRCSASSAADGADTSLRVRAAAASEHQGQQHQARRAGSPQPSQAAERPKTQAPTQGEGAGGASAAHLA